MSTKLEKNNVEPPNELTSLFFLITRKTNQFPFIKIIKTYLKIIERFAPRVPLSSNQAFIYSLGHELKFNGISTAQWPIRKERTFKGLSSNDSHLKFFLFLKRVHFLVLHFGVRAQPTRSPADIGRENFLNNQSLFNSIFLFISPFCFHHYPVTYVNRLLFIQTLN